MLDIVTIQSSFEDVIEDVSTGAVTQETFWVGLRLPNQPQTLFDVTVTKNQLNCEILDIKKVKDIYHFHNKTTNTTYKLAKGHTFIKQLGITSINKLGPELILGTNTGSLIIYNLDTNHKKVFEKCHLMDIIDIQVFPSKEVILTVGLDHQIILWSIKEWKLIRTFKALNSSNVELIGRGRNFLVAVQGELQMWECGSGAVVYRYKKVKNDCINVIKVVENGETQGKLEVKDSQNQFEIQGKLVFIGYSSGDIKKMNLLTKTVETLNILTLAISSLQYFKEHLIIGTETGQLVIWKDDVKFTRQLNPFAVKVIVHNGDLFIYNGEETLVKMRFDFDVYCIRETVYLGGLPEFFRVESMVYEGGLIVGSDYGVMIYQ